jgi:predicted nucleotidyltransferase component of viral defense system
MIAMLDLNQIRSEFPPQLQANPRNFLREYLQYKILEIVFGDKTAVKLTLIGGTAVRIAHNSQRFSEDLDFDSKNLSASEFENLIANLEQELIRLGLKTSIRIVTILSRKRAKGRDYFDASFLTSREFTVFVQTA